MLSTNEKNTENGIFCGSLFKHVAYVCSATFPVYSSLYDTPAHALPELQQASHT